MKICEMFLKAAQVIPKGGRVFQCCFMSYEHINIGNLMDNSLEEVWNGEKNRWIFDCLSKGDYTPCDLRWCPFFVDGKPENVPLVEIDEMPKLPLGFGLSYENVCNYNCTCCHADHDGTDSESEKEYKIIEEKLAPYLPYLKSITSNGSGELFACKHTLKQLANWRPIAPKEDISVRLISNGSLFNEQNWKKIENLGQYNLEVQVSVMSFEDRLHRILSGTNVPISTIESNLLFIKKLREQGIVNNFIISMVVQDRNFYSMPEFTKRCIEDFGVDKVLLQPVAFVNPNNFDYWLQDIRNVYHPYHKDYLKVMEEPIFKNPKVIDWSFGRRESGVGQMPALLHVKKTKQYRKWESQIFRQLFTDRTALDNLEQELQKSGSKVIIHGAGSLGMAIAKNLSDCGKVEVSYITDFKQSGDFLGIPIVNPKSPPPRFTNRICL